MQKCAHMGTFLMFFAFSDLAPSYLLNFEGTWFSNQEPPRRTHKTRLYRRVLRVRHPPLPPTLLLPSPSCEQQKRAQVGRVFGVPLHFREEDTNNVPHTGTLFVSSLFHPF